MARYRVAVVGLGIGEAHIAQAWRGLPDLYELRALCDLDEARLSLAAGRYGVDATTDFNEILQRDDIDIVDICTPPSFHEPQTIAALEAGKHVVCEKPLAGSIAAVDRITRAAILADRRVMPIFQYRHGQGAAEARAIIDAGLAGKPLIATSETFWTRGADYYSPPWRGTWSKELGGTMTIHAIHIHDIATWLMGPVDRVFGRIETLLHDIENEDTACMSLRFCSGAIGAFSATVGSQREYSRLHLGFENVSFTSSPEPYAVGRGPWTIDARDPAMAKKVEEVRREVPQVRELFAGQMAAFYDALQDGGPLPVTPEDARQSIELLTAFYASAETGSDIALPISEGDPLYAGWPQLARSSH